MERYVYIDSINDLKKIHSINKKVGEGSEGTAYLTSEKKVLKINNGFEPYEIKDNEKENIIMAQDYNVSSYIFPEQLYICKDIVVGYLQEYFANDILMNGIYKNILFHSHDKIPIDIEKLLIAREKMMKDTKIITEGKIYTFDLCNNLLFDGNRLGAIDTIRYYKDSEITLDKNIENIDYSLLNELDMYDKTLGIDTNKSFDENIKRLKHMR